MQFVPGVRLALSLGMVVPEALYLAKMQIDIALVISLLYEKDITEDDARGAILTCFVLALGADFAKRGLNIAAIRLTERMVEKAITQMGERQLIALLENIGSHATKSGILKKVPIVAVPINAALNYGQIQAFGGVVKKFMSPSFVMCGKCSEEVGKLSRFCPKCGTPLESASGTT